MEHLYRTWGSGIAKRRAELGLTQQQLAERVEVEQQAVSKWELGLTAPRNDIKLRLAAVFGVDANELFPLVPVPVTAPDPVAS